MIDLGVTDLRTFVPAQDFAQSKAFYLAIGCTLEWSDDNLAMFEIGPRRFYLQRYYVKDWAENSMLHLSVRDARACHAQLQALVDSGAFPGVRVAAPAEESYGALVTYAWDPSGVLLHLAQWLEPASV